MKVCTFDIETSDLKGDVGRILCASVLRHDGDLVTYRSDDYGTSRSNDKALVKDIRKELEEHDCLIGWYCKGFDIPFIRTRLAAHGERLLAPRLVVDALWHLRGWRGLNPRSSKLAVAAEFFKIKDRKMNVDVEVWIEAALGGNKKAMDILVDRCESDVLITKEVTDKIFALGLVKNIGTY